MLKRSKAKTRARVAVLGSLALAGALMLGACSSAADTSSEARTVEGEITAVSGESVTVKTADGQGDTFLVSDATEITRGQDAQGQPGQASGGTSGGGEPPAKPDGEAGAADGGNGGEPPAKPEGEGGSSDGSEPPAKPEGEAGGTPDGAPGGPSGEGGSSGDLSLTVGMTVVAEVGADNVATSVTITSMGAAGGPGAGGPGAGGSGGSGPGGSQAPTSYAAAYTYTEDATVADETLESTGTDENVVLADSDIAVTLENDKITRTSSDSTGGDNASFYGVGAALLATAGTLNVQNCTIATDAKGGAGVFAYGAGVVEVSDTNIVTTQDTSGGIHVAGGGTLHAVNVTAETNGESSAAIRSDRGSGTMTVEGGSFTSNGTGSPAIYSTADITVRDAALKATNSEAICIEGFNSIRLTDCDLTGNQPDDARNEIVWNVILYQSMSGDSQEGNATFAMEGGTLTAEHGGMFYTTNTESTFVIKDVAIVNSADNPFLLRCTGNANQRGWGSAGSNGADCSFTAIQQSLEGDVQWDSISQLDMYLTDGSTLAGAFVQDESAAGSGGDGYAKLSVEEGSTWVVTGDSTLTELACAGTLRDAEGRAVGVVDASGAVLASGDSPYTVTVSAYSTTPDLSGAQSIA